MRQLVQRLYGYIDKDFTEEGNAYAIKVHFPLLEITGVRPSFRPEKFWLTTFILVHNFTNLSLHVYYFLMSAFFSQNDFTEFSQYLNMSVVVAVSLSAAFTLVLCRSDMNKVHNAFAKGFTEYGPVLAEYKATLKKSEEKERLILTAVLSLPCGMSGFSLVFLGPLIDKYFGATFTDFKSNIYYSLPIPEYQPYNIDKSTFLWLLTVFHQVTAAFLCATILISAVEMFFTMIIKTVNEMKLLIKSLELIDQRCMSMLPHLTTASTAELYRNPDFIQAYEHCLKETTNHHQLLLRVLNDFMNASGYTTFVTFGFGSLLIALTTVEIIFVDKPGVLVSSIFMALTEVSIILPMCLYGEMVTSLSDEFRRAIYGLKWYYLPKRINRYVMIVQEVTLKNLIFQGYLTPINLETFGVIINSAYSFFNLLLATKE